MSARSLYIALYLDEDVSVVAGDLLHAHGFDVLTTRDAQNLGQSDQAQLSYATLHQRAIFTHNRMDFEALHVDCLHEKRAHAGILIANRRASDLELARRIMKLLDTFTADEVVNQLLYL